MQSLRAAASTYGPVGIPLYTVTYCPGRPIPAASDCSAIAPATHAIRSVTGAVHASSRLYTQFTPGFVDAVNASP